MIYEKAIEYLEQHGKEIGAELDENPKAQKVFDAYNFYYLAPGGQALLAMAVDDYVKSKE